MLKLCHAAGQTNSAYALLSELVAFDKKLRENVWQDALSLGLFFRRAFHNIASRKEILEHHLTCLCNCMSNFAPKLSTSRNDANHNGLHRQSACKPDLHVTITDLSKHRSWNGNEQTNNEGKRFGIEKSISVCLNSSRMVRMHLSTWNSKFCGPAF